MAWSSFTIDVAATVVAAAIIAVASAVGRMSRSVRESAAVMGQLADAIATLQEHDAQTRARLAALEWPRHNHHGREHG